MDGKRVPPGWKSVSLDEIAHIIMGQSPDATVVNEDGAGLPFIQGNAEFGSRHPSPNKWCTKPAKKASAGDVLLSVRAPVGALNIADRDLAIGRGLSAIRFNDGITNFGWYALNLGVAQLGKVAQGSTFTAVGRKEVGGLRMLLPTLPERRKIAEILSTVDDAIKRTESVVQQVQVVKRGLMQQLLIRGLPGRHTRFKPTEVGEIPADWQVVRLGAVTEVVSGFAIGPSRRQGSNRKPYLTVANVQAGYVRLGEPRFMEVTPTEYKNRQIMAGDILVVEGHAQISELGRAAIAPSEVEGYTFQNHLFRVRVNPRFCDSTFLCTFINGPRGRAYFRSFGGTSSGLNTVSTTNVQGMPVPLPPVTEQRAISQALQAVEDQLAIEREANRQMREVKDALMQVLLTGEIRVKVEEETCQTA